MVELVDARNFQLVPDATKAIQQGLLVGQQFRQGQQQRTQFAQQQEQLQQDKKLKKATENAVRLQGLQPDAQLQELERQKTQAGLEGRNAPGVQQLINMLNEGRGQEANQIINQAVNFGEQFGIIKPRQGFTSVETRGGLPTGIRGGVLQEIPTTPEVSAAMARKPVEGVTNVQSSKTFPGGLVQLIGEGGQVELIQPKEAERKLIEQAEERGAMLQGLRSGERRAASEAQGQAIAAFKQLTGVRKGIRNLEEGIDLIDGGAKSGIVMGRLPSVKAASVKLDNVHARLGLDIISSVTFGPLSEKELKFAMSAALPRKGLSPPELRQWLVDKRDVQVKLADYLNEAAIFLGTPGNTVADFLSVKGEQKATQAAQPPQQTPSPTPNNQVGRFSVEIVQ